MAEAVIVTLDAMRAAQQRSEMVDAVFKTGTILGLGGLLYMGWWMYRFSNNISISTRNAVGEVVAVEFPPVDPWLRTEEARAAYAESLKLEYGILDVEAARGGFGVGIYTTRNVTPASTASLKLKSFDDARRFISEDGSFTGYTDSYYMIYEARNLLLKYGYEVSGEGLHPVDAVANFVLNDKWYWGGVLGLASLPALSLGIKTVREITSKEMNEYAEGR